MAGDSVRLVFAVVLIFCILGLILHARGEPHHHGDSVGSTGASYSLQR